MSQTLFLKSSLTIKRDGKYCIPSHMVVGRKENVYRKSSTRQLQNHSVKYYLSGTWDYIQSLLQTMFSFMYYVFFLGMSLIILRAGYLTRFEEHKYFMSSFFMCAVHILTSIHSLTPIHLRCMCTDICHA